MPRVSGSKHIGAWGRCDRCGWEWRLNDMQMQNGLLLCTPCVDNTLMFVRDRIIAEVLADTSEEMQPQEGKKRANEGFRPDDFSSP